MIKMEKINRSEWDKAIEDMAARIIKENEEDAKTYERYRKEYERYRKDYERYREGVKND